MFNKIIGGVTKMFKNQNKYTIKGKEYYEEKLVGEGGYGYVYVVVDPTTNQKYALKRMNIQSKEILENIKREIEHWKKINDNENIVRMIDYEILDKSVNILMELCTDGTLLDYINNSTNAITEKQILYIIREISLALLHMHSQDKPIAHRDIKIENVLRFGKKLKLCDFGSCSTQTLDPSQIDKNTKLQQFSIFEKNTTFMYRSPEMCDQTCNYKINEKVDIWALGCIFYTLMYKKHPFCDAQRLTIINAQYFCPEVNYSEKLLDFMRLLLTPNPDKRPDIKKVLQIIQSWDNVTKIELCKEVQEIKEKQIDNNKRSNGDLLTEEEILRIQQKIRADEEKKKKKNPYKYQKNDDNVDVNEIFGDFEENHETKITTKQGNVNNKNKGNNAPNIKNEQKTFDPFNNNQALKNENAFNWMLDMNNNQPNNANNNNEMKNNNFLNFDFVDSGSQNNNNSPSKSNNNFNDIHNIFSMPSTNVTVDNNTNSKGFNFNQQPVNTFADFKFEVHNNPHQSKSNSSAHSGFNLIDMNATNCRSKSPNVNDTSVNNCFPHVGNNNQMNNVNHNPNLLGSNLNMNNNNKSKSPNPTHLSNKVHNNPQDIYDFFK